MIIPYKEISADALQGLIEEFISREGTDYGEIEISLAQKCQQVKALLQKGEAVVAFDMATETVSIISRQDVALLNSSQD